MSNTKELAKELCEKSTCHHKCHDTKDCVVEDEAKEVIANSAITTEKQIEEMAKLLRPLTLCPNCLSSLNRDKKRDGGCYKPIGYECPLDRDILKYCNTLYNAGYRKHTDRFLAKENGEIIPLLPKQSEGHWIENEDDFWVMCSECGTEFLDDQIGIVNTYSYCPNCGAKMKGGEE